MKRRNYLDDYQKNPDGSYTYVGERYVLQNSGEAYKLLCFPIVLFILVFGSGYINAAGMSNTYYVIIPFMLEVLCTFEVLWHSAQMFPRKGVTFEYRYIPSLQKTPVFAAASAVFSGAGLVCSFVFLLLNGSEGKTAQCVLYLMLKLLCLALALIYRKVFLSLQWEKK